MGHACSTDLEVLDPTGNAGAGRDERIRSDDGSTCDNWCRRSTRIPFTGEAGFN